MRPTEYGKLKKIGPGHYKVVWPPKRGPKPKLKSRNLHPADFVPLENQIPGMKYCRICTLQLSANNTCGLCRGCVPFDQKRITDGS